MVRVPQKQQKDYIKFLLPSKWFYYYIIYCGKMFNLRFTNYYFLNLPFICGKCDKAAGS